jgi:alpha-glucosidase
MGVPPKDYINSTKRYSVLYMHDAQNLFDSKTSYVGEWNIDEKLDSINASVIGIEHGNDKRMDELTPNDKWWRNADAYLEFIVKTLKPQIDKSTELRQKEKTLIMGSSLGGLVSYYAILKYPQVFGKRSSVLLFGSQIKYSMAENTKK